MNPQELAYYLQGFFEITDAKILTPEQVAKIREKVQSCFQKVTPDRNVYASDASKAINSPSLADKQPKIDDYYIKIDQSNPTLFSGLTGNKPFQNPLEGDPACALSTTPQTC